jgi:hypothetical protein
MLPILNELKAEQLLVGSTILDQVAKLKSSLKYRTSEESYDYEAYYNILVRESKSIPRINLEAQIPPGQGQRYLIDLASALEQITDSIEMTQTKTLFFVSKLKSALSMKTTMQATFTAWYQIALAEKLREIDVKFPVGTQKVLAESEFSRLLDYTDLDLDSLLGAVEVLIDHLKQTKKIALEKYKLGVDQVNTSIAHLPFHGIKEAQEFPVLSQRWGMTKEKPPQDTFDDEEDPLPDYVEEREHPAEESSLATKQLLAEIQKVSVAEVMEGEILQAISDWKSSIVDVEEDKSIPPQILENVDVIDDPFLGRVKISDLKPKPRTTIKFDDEDDEPTPQTENRQPEKQTEIKPTLVTVPKTETTLKRRPIVFDDED